MTEDLIAMAKLAGYDLEKDQTCREVSTAEIFSTFYRLVDAQAVARTREECAKVCDKYARKTVEAQSGSPDALTNIMLRQVAHLGFEQAAGAIRDGEKP